MLLLLLSQGGPTDDFTFTGADGASWGPGWTFVQGTGDILTNRGRMVTGTGAFDGSSAIFDAGDPNVVVQIDTEVPTNDAQFPEIRWRYDNTTGDGLLLIFEPHNDIVQLYPYASFVRGAQIGSNISFAVAAGDIIHTKIMSVGHDHYVRLWKNADPEPSTWERAFTDSTGAGNTHIMVRTVTSNLGVSVTNFWDNLVVSPATWAGADATITVTATSATFAPGTATWAGTGATVTVTATEGAFSASGSPQTWTGTDATATVTATSATFAPGTATWAGTDATVTVTATEGAFSSGGSPQTWVGTDGTVTVTATSATFAPGAVTWVGTDATVTVTATSSTFSSGGSPQTWTGTDATVTVTATSATFAPGTVTWVGTDGTITVAAASGSFAPGSVTWVGTDGTITVATLSGAFAISGAPQTWAGTGGTLTIAATSRTFEIAAEIGAVTTIVTVLDARTIVTTSSVDTLVTTPEVITR